MEQALLTVEQVAARLNLSRSGVYQLHYRGVLPAIHIKAMNALRFEPQDVNALLEKRAQKRNKKAASPAQ